MTQTKPDEYLKTMLLYLHGENKMEKEALSQWLQTVAEVK